jgi:hypothetical protein
MRYSSIELRSLLSKMLKKDPKARADMETLRADPWVNFEEIERPLRIVPKVTQAPTASQISQFIASITKDESFVVYTIRQHMRDGSSVIGASIDKNKTLKKNVTSRRRSMSSGPPALGDLIRLKSESLQQPSNIIEDIEDEVSELPKRIGTTGSPAMAVNRPRPRRLSMLDTRSQSSSSPFSSARGIGPISASKSPSFSTESSSSTDSPDSSSNGIFPRRSRRNTINLDFRGFKFTASATPVAAKADDQSSEAGSTSSGILRKSDLSSGNNIEKQSSNPLSPHTLNRTRRASVANGEERPLSVMRRMSMVSPDSGGFPISPSITQTFSANDSPTRRLSFSTKPITSIFNNKTAVDSIMDSTISTSSSNSSSPGITSPTKSLQINLDETENIESVDQSNISEDNVTMTPSKKEIEDWHLMHRPPKEIRTARYSFNSKTTSSMSPSTIFQDVHRVLLVIQTEMGDKLSFSRDEDFYLLNCKITGMGPAVDVEFEIEVCKLWLLRVHGVRIKRLGGSAFTFKEIYGKICDLLQI